MHIVHIASELAPLAKVGGLADVLLGLNRELSWRGHDVDIIIPKYDCLDTNEIRDLTVEVQDLPCFFGGEWTPTTVWMGWVENLKVYFIEPHHPRHFFSRSCFYGCDDDVDRYLAFSRCVLDFMAAKKMRPEIIHLHDWQTAVIAPLLKDVFTKKGLGASKIVFTIHNLEYQGKCAPYHLDQIGLDARQLLTKDKMQDPYFSDTINLLKGAIIYSDFVTTVSPNYAWEIKTVEGGRGLNDVIVAAQDKFCGILNGIDYSYWNPETDRYLPTHFSSREIPNNKWDRNTIDKKAFIKKTLREKTGLAEVHCPLIGCITRLVPQKGIELIRHVIETAEERRVQVVLLGSSPIPSITQEFHELKARFTDSPNVHLYLQHQEELAHLIFAGSDLFIVPSLFEPCGLTQLISMKYGSIPVVRKTGGLADTVFDVDWSERKPEDRNGYTFDFPDEMGIDSALDRAVSCWYHDSDRFRKLMMNAMTMDFSWNKPATKYLDVYKTVSKT